MSDVKKLIEELETPSEAQKKVEEVLIKHGWHYLCTDDNERGYSKDYSEDTIAVRLSGAWAHFEPTTAREHCVDEDVTPEALDAHLTDWEHDHA